MRKVRDILETKGRDVWFIEPGASVYTRKIILQGRASPTTEVREIMTPRVVYAEPDRNVEECMALMTEKRIRHLPVMEQGQVCGVISIGDLVKAIITEQKFIIEQLERYITG